jgi:cytochrome c peroxidase
VRLGERLFHESRFAQQFAVRVEGRALDDPLPGGDPALDVVETTGAPLPGPYAGRSFSCAACHLSDEMEGVPGGGARAHCDFARRSPLPARDDGRTHTTRNAPALLDAAIARSVPVRFHFDGEFETLEALCEGTLVGRSLGWKPDERAAAVAHVARVLREDDGSGGDADGAAYADLFAGTAGLAPDGALLPPVFRVDVATATDEDVLAAAARLVAEYVRSLPLGPDGESPRPSASPYDVFLAKNGLPTAPDPGETDLEYGRRLRSLLLSLSTPVDVTPADGSFRTHAHPFRFGAAERRGLLAFLTESGPGPGGVGSCVSCHAPPSFTDARFHNVGASQSEYDLVHGLESFEALPVPGLAARNADPARFLPPSALHPAALGELASAPRESEPQRADLGLWNVLGNPALPGAQAAVRAEVTARLSLAPDTPDDVLLPLTIGWMKTPPLRDLGHSGPYFHGGHVDTLEEVVQHYRAVGLSASTGLVRNAAPELAGIRLDVPDLADVAAFLRALDEDPR